MRSDDLILQPRTGTHIEHAMSALSRMTISEVRDDHRSEKIRRSLRNEARAWCVGAGLSPDEQPESLIEGAFQDDHGYACMEVISDPFVRMLYCIYGVVAGPTTFSGTWDSMRMATENMERHFLLVEDEDVVTPPSVTLEFLATRVLTYDIRVLSDDTFELRGREPYVFGDRFHGAWHGPFPASEFPTMFPGQEMPKVLHGNPDDI